MKNLVRQWMNGVELLIAYDTISFYVFFSIIFAECAFLWARTSQAVAIPFTIILVAYILNAVVCGLFKGNWENSRTELVFSILYVAIFIAIFIIGCTFSVKTNFILTLIPYGITFVFVVMRKNSLTVLIVIKNFKVAKFLHIAEIFITVVCPFVAFITCFAMLPSISVIAKVIVAILYLPCAPFICLLEDEAGAFNIFEIAYDVSWLYESKSSKD